MNLHRQYDREQIEIFISARKLKDKDVISKSDPKCKIYLKEANGVEKCIG